MKIENIFCDICGREGALTQKKDARHLVAQHGSDKDRKYILKCDDGRSIPHFSISYAKRIHGGGVEEIDLCSHCTSTIETETSKTVFELFKKSRNKNNSSKSD